MKLIDILVEELPKRGGWPEGAAFVAQEEGGWLWSFTSKPQKDCDDEWMDESSRGYHNKVGKLPEASDHDTSAITREQYEAALEAKNDGWIEWGGGKCPVEKGTLIDVKWRDGKIDTEIPAKIKLPSRDRQAIIWHHSGYELDIIAYRLHQPQEVAHTEAEQELDLNECIGQAPATIWGGEGLPPVGCECEWQDKNTKQWNPVKVVYASEWVTVIREINKEKGDDLVEIAIENYGDDARLKFRPTRSEAERKRHDAAQALCYAGGGIGKVDESAGIGSCWFDVYDAIAAGKIPGVKLED